MTQARLDWITAQDPSHFRAWLTWRGRLRIEADVFTSEEIALRLEELPPLIEAQERLLDRTPEQWNDDGIAWEKARQKLERLRGQEQAFREAAAGGSSSARGSRLSTSIPAGEWDPFANE